MTLGLPTAWLIDQQGGQIVGDVGAVVGAIVAARFYLQADITHERP